MSLLLLLFRLTFVEVDRYFGKVGDDGANGELACVIRFFIYLSRQCLANAALYTKWGIKYKWRANAKFHCTFASLPVDVLAFTLLSSCCSPSPFSISFLSFCRYASCLHFVFFPSSHSTARLAFYINSTNHIQRLACSAGMSITLKTRIGSWGFKERISLCISHVVRIQPRLRATSAPTFSAQ